MKAIIGWAVAGFACLALSVFYGAILVAVWGGFALFCAACHFLNASDKA